ncbi:MAG: phospholipase [Chloroflexota bacterium]
MKERIHQDNDTLTHGATLENAKVAVLLMHGRGASAPDLLPFVKQLPQADDVVYMMPQATQNTWYPNSGFGSFEANEPFLSSAWGTIDERLAQIKEAGIGQENIIVGGFSQGACLMSEYVARNAGQYGGLLVLSGALMGTEHTSRDYKGSLAGTQVWVGGANNDPWVTGKQLNETATVFEKLGATVSKKIHDSSDHTIRPADVESATNIINAVREV